MAGNGKSKNKSKNSKENSLQKQINTLKSRVGYPEKLNTSLEGRASFGAFNTAGGGEHAARVIDITPPTLHTVYTNIAGTGGRTGRMINMKSMQVRLRFTSDLNRVNGGKITLYLVRQPNTQLDLTVPQIDPDIAGVGHFLEPDPWVSDTQGYSCYTTQSLRSTELGDYGKFRVIAKRQINFPMEAVGSISAVGVKNVDIFKKIDFPVEYEVGAVDNQDAVRNKMHMICVCDGGNIAQASQTGFLVQYNIKYNYTDN